MFDRAAEQQQSMSERVHQLVISGMTCTGCSGRVERVLSTTPGVLRASISHETNSGVVVTTETLSTQNVVDIVAGTGFGVSASP